jgi:hypothetical protein
MYNIMANYNGFTHIAFEVEDVETTLSIALSNGAARDRRACTPTRELRRWEKRG